MTKDEALTLEALKYAASKGYGLRETKLGSFTIKSDKALAQPALEQNFCPRCGKRTKDIHACTPLQEKNNVAD